MSPPIGMDLGIGLKKGPKNRAPQPVEIDPARLTGVGVYVPFRGTTRRVTGTGVYVAAPPPEPT